MHNSPKISIIIPIYNVEKFLKQCLDSVINQTFKDVEIICINDCSTDNSLQITKEYQQKDKRIKIINLKENTGVSNARNIGLNSARGEYITFIDSDDWISPDYIEILYNKIKKYNTDFVGSDFYICKDEKITNMGIIVDVMYDTIITSKKSKRKFLQYLKFLSISQVWAKIFKKSFIKQNNILFFQLETYEDNIFMWEAIIKSDSFIFIKDKIYYYRFNREKSLTKLNTIDNKLLFFNKLYLLNKQDCYKKYLSDFYTYISIDTCHYVEKADIKDANSFFLKFKTSFYNKNFKLTYECINLKNKIRLFIFSFCLKYNINYITIGKFHRNYNPIRFFTGKKEL